MRLITPSLASLDRDFVRHEPFSLSSLKKDLRSVTPSSLFRFSLCPPSLLAVSHAAAPPLFLP